MSMVGRIRRSMLPLVDVALLTLILPSALILKFYRKTGSNKLQRNTSLLKRLGVFPIVNHYYEPLFDDRLLKVSLREKRDLPGIDFKIDEQLALLGKLGYADEFKRFVESEKTRTGAAAFKIDNDSFGSGDADFLYQYLRHVKPKKVIEIGCGSSTKVASAALIKNQEETGVAAEQLCVEPFEQPWLESFPNIKLLRKKIEDCDLDWSNVLSAGDLLFIDSSHMIRPQGDVLHEYLNIIPVLKPGVIVHVHDIFTPRDYMDSGIRDYVFFWNEQYLLEAMLGNTARYDVIAALNYLRHDYYDNLMKVCPYLTPSREPASFYFKVR